MKQFMKFCKPKCFRLLFSANVSLYVNIGMYFNNNFKIFNQSLTLKMPVKTAADDSHEYVYCFLEKKYLIFHLGRGFK